MRQFITITSQGQVSIPIILRRKLGLNKFRKALVDIEGKKIIIEPVADVLEFGGKLYNKAIKNKNIDRVIKMEEDALGKGAVGRYFRHKDKSKK